MKDYFSQTINPERTVPPKRPRYRTIKQCLVELKKLDPDSAISEWFIRQLCKSNQIAYQASGNKSIVNLTDLLKYLGYAEGLYNV